MNKFDNYSNPISQIYIDFFNSDEYNILPDKVHFDFYRNKTPYSNVEIIYQPKSDKDAMLYMAYESKSEPFSIVNLFQSHRQSEIYVKKLSDVKAQVDFVIQMDSVVCELNLKKRIEDYLIDQYVINYDDFEYMDKHNSTVRDVFKLTDYLNEEEMIKVVRSINLNKPVKTYYLTNPYEVAKILTVIYSYDGIENVCDKVLLLDVENNNSININLDNISKNNNYINGMIDKLSQYHILNKWIDKGKLIFGLKVNCAGATYFSRPNFRMYQKFIVVFEDDYYTYLHICKPTPN